MLDEGRIRMEANAERHKDAGYECRYTVVKLSNVVGTEDEREWTMTAGCMITTGRIIMTASLIINRCKITTRRMIRTG